MLMTLTTSSSSTGVKWLQVWWHHLVHLGHFWMSGGYTLYNRTGLSLKLIDSLL